jgi:enoyl-CoA hydratase/carnithine racemase
MSTPAPAPSLVVVEIAGPVATLWLDRADKRNALNDVLMRDLAAALDRVRDDAALRVIVLRGRGPVFSSGIDHTLLMDVMQKSRHVPFVHLHHDLQDVFHRMERMQKPIVCALQRACVGMALELALAADFRIATADCVLGLPEIAFGIIPDVGGTTRLHRAVGPTRAKELVMTGKLVRGKTAERLGLVHECAEDEADLDRRVTRLVERLAAHPPVAMGMAKSLCAAAAESDAATSFRLEGIFQQLLMTQPDLATQFPKALQFIKERMADAE